MLGATQCSIFFTVYANTCGNSPAEPHERGDEIGRPILLAQGPAPCPGQAASVAPRVDAAKLDRVRGSKQGNDWNVYAGGLVKASDKVLREAYDKLSYFSEACNKLVEEVKPTLKQMEERLYPWQRLPQLCQQHGHAIPNFSQAYFSFTAASRLVFPGATSAPSAPKARPTSFILSLDAPTVWARTGRTLRRRASRSTNSKLGQDQKNIQENGIIWNRFIAAVSQARDRAPQDFLQAGWLHKWRGLRWRAFVHRMCLAAACSKKT